MDEKLKELLEKAQANFNEQREKNEALTKQIADLQGKLDTVTEQMKNGVDSGQLQTKMEELVEEISDLRSKYRAPASVITDDQQKKAIHDVVMKSFGAFMKKNKGTTVPHSPHPSWSVTMMATDATTRTDVETANTHCGPKRAARREANCTPTTTPSEFAANRRPYCCASKP